MSRLKAAFPDLIGDIDFETGNNAVSIRYFRPNDWNPIPIRLGPQGLLRTTWSPPRDPGPVYEIVREHCSFHLLRPMTEAYFFADPDALRRAKVVAEPILPAGLDLEQFQTIDSAYSAVPFGHKSIKDSPARERHPKSYLYYLCDPTLVDKKLRYKETLNGVEALRGLNWSRAVLVARRHEFDNANHVAHSMSDDDSIAPRRQGFGHRDQSGGNRPESRAVRIAIVHA